MADSPATTGASPVESPAQEKARLRRERRAAKIQDGGASRLHAITALQGGTHRDIEKDVPVKPAPTASTDPEEIDISTHHYTPAAQPRLPSPFAFNGSSTPPQFPGAAPGSHPNQDPMMAMMQQMLGGGMPGNAGGPGQPGQQPDLPPALANLFSGMQGGGGAASAPSPDQSSAWIWKLVHSLFSLLLSIYIVLGTPFTGSKVARTAPATGDEDWTLDSSPGEAFKHFFYLFATFEVVLQSSRYFIEKGQLQGGGMLSTVAQLLPQPYGNYVRVVGRYSVIYTTVVSDAMVVVFVLGAACYWRGGMAV
ncbi:hypothetical protein K491DRAFT_706715 [Lophiostoma macrostomum CBS 122681]|uniref:GET complex, subunit GET2 n=1 Tax=Lophiostoma macrostomum CBS 122681 TaxID=1314788 RepID=A0A6A6SY72_9PLEO|nr:hypothetical protein K491DRAFT_706715 [Lophiostoma macrostomum CBS 122681]